MKNGQFAARKGQQSLLELDNYRYGQALEEYGLGRAGSREMDLDAVTKLVSWKL